MASAVVTPPLLEGDSLTSEEFLRRWDEMPDVRRAELIDGIVFMSSPLSNDHGDYQAFLNGWLTLYSLATPGCRPIAEATWLMGQKQVPQPDLALRILTEYGGQSGITGQYASGAPELIVEVAVSSYARDFGVKKRLYERTGVREYLIAVPREKKLVAFHLTSAGYQAMEPDASGVISSVCFPGLWLDTNALWALDLQAMNSVLQQGLATAEHNQFIAQLAASREMRG